MTSYGAAQMASSFRTVRNNTIQIAEDIPESKYDFVAAPGTQSVAAMLKQSGKVGFEPHLVERPVENERHRTQRRIVLMIVVGMIRIHGIAPEG